MPSYKPTLTSLAEQTLQSDEEKKVVEQGDLALAFIAGPAWTLTLDWLEAREDKALNAMRTCKSSDPAVVNGLMRAWQQHRATLNEFQEYVHGLIADRNALVNQEGANG